MRPMRAPPVTRPRIARTRQAMSRGAWLRRDSAAARADRVALGRKLAAHELEALGSYYWEGWARDDQLPPREAWRTWLITAGRGFGKTRAGAEWVRSVARADAGARIALVGASLTEVRNVMVEGDSGVLAAAPGALPPTYEPSLRRLTWENGAMAWLYSAGEPETLRGPQHSHAWCDEIAKWDNAGGRAMSAWNNLQLTMRLGDAPRVLATSTPRDTPLMRHLMAEAERGAVALAQGASQANSAILPADYYEHMIAQFEGTRFGRQELDGEMLEGVEGALWNRALIDRCRIAGAPPVARRVVVGVDPPATSSGDACGIVVAEIGTDGVATVRADCSVARPSPERWARAVANAAQCWDADRVVVERNQGGEMVESVLRAADIRLPVRAIHASRGKAARAEPVAALYEAGRVRHAGFFPDLEDEMCALSAGGGYHGPGRSPDRVDALVYALTELMLDRPAPRLGVKLL